MSLYNNYRISNSTQVPQFAGSVLPELKEAASYLEEKYIAGKSGTDAAELIKNTTAYHSADAKKFTEEAAKVAADIETIRARGDYEMQLQQIDGVAKRAAYNLRPFGDVMTARQAEFAKLDDKELALPETTKARLRARQDAAYAASGGVQVDPATGMLKGNYGSISAAAYVDTREWVDTIMKDRVIQEGGSGGAWSNGEYIYQTKEGWKRFTKQDIAEITSQAAAQDQKLQAHLQQEAMLAGFDASTRADIVYEKANPVMKAEIDAEIAKGVPLKDAVAQVAARTELNRLSQAIMGYGIAKYEQNDYTFEKNMKEDGYGLAARTAAENAKFDANLITAHPAISENTKETLQDLNGRIVDTKQTVQSLARNLSDVYEIDPQTGNLKMAADGSFVLKAGVSRERVGEVAADAERYRSGVAQLNQDREIQSFAISQAASKNNMTVAQFDAQLQRDVQTYLENFKTWSDGSTGLTRGTGIKEVGKFLLNAANPSKSPMRVGASAFVLKDQVTLGDIRKAAKNVTSKNVDSEGNIHLPGGVVIEGSAVTKRIMTYASSNYNNAKKNFAVSRPGVVIAPKLKDDLKASISTNQSNYTFYDNADTRTAMSQEQMSKIDWKTLELHDAVAGFGNATLLPATVEIDGKPAKITISDPGTGNLASEIYRLTAQNPTSTPEAIQNAGHLTLNSLSRRLADAAPGVPIPINPNTPHQIAIQKTAVNGQTSFQVLAGNKPVMDAKGNYLSSTSIETALKNAFETHTRFYPNN